MRVFVTGATGFVGSAVVPELLAAGHHVTGLARSEASAAALEKAGAKPLSGSLEDLEVLKRGAAESDGVIHCGFIHDFSKLVENCEIDRRAIEAMGETLAGSDRPLIVTSGLAFLASGRAATEEDRPPSGAQGYPRVSESTAFAFEARGVRAMAIRLAPSVHGDGDHGFVPLLIGLARQKGVSAYVGDGQNRWPGVHRLDAGALYRLALEKGASGARFHGVAEEGAPFRQIAEVIGRRLGLPVVSKSVEEAKEHFGWFAAFAGMDCPTSSAWTRETLGWRPTHPGLIDDLDRPAYFAG